MQQVQRLENETLEIARAVGAERYVSPSMFCTRHIIFMEYLPHVMRLPSSCCTTPQLRTNLFRSECRLEARRIHRLQHLRLIFPIRLVPVVGVGTSSSSVNHPPNTNNTLSHRQHQHTIAGIPLPNDVHGPAVTDDQVSTALGFLCHLVALTSKYLAIPTRFPLVCKFSRSAVVFGHVGGGGGGGGTGNVDGGERAVYPLFRERGVDREQLDYGMILLGRNVDCLLGARGVEFDQGWNALATVDRLLAHVIEGEDPSLAG